MPAELNKGFAVVIDDKLDGEQDGDLIFKIISKIEAKGIPVCRYKTVEEAETFVNNFLELNFLILDWMLYPEKVGITVGQEAKDRNALKNIAFIGKFKEVCFAPILIFSNEAEKDIKADFDKFSPELVNEEPSRNFILIKKKSEVAQDEKLFETINQWIKGNPAIYTLKMWNNSFLEAKNGTFWHLFDRSPIWPRVLWNAFKIDSVDESTNIYDLLYRLIKGRINHTPLDEKSIVIPAGPGENAKDVKEVIQGTMYSAKIPTNDVQPGDVFKMGKGKYLINIRPVCDTVLGRLGPDERPTYDGKLYLLEGCKASKKDLTERLPKKGKYGIVEQNNEVVLFGVDGKDFLIFSFKKLVTIEFENIKDKRIQRLLPPYLTHLQQKYGAYASRVGLPRFPDEVLNEITELTPEGV